MTREWKSKVRAELERRGRGSFTRLAEEIGASTGKLGDLLSDDDERSPSTSPLVAPINAFFGWALPLAPSTSRDSAEIQYLHDRLTQEQRRQLKQAADLINSPDSETREAFATLLRALQRKAPSNDHS